MIETRDDVKWLRRAVQALHDYNGIRPDGIRPDGIRPDGGDAEDDARQT